MVDGTDDGVTITRRRLLGSILTLGAAGSATGAGTYATFEDTEQSRGNTVTAGTLDLVLGFGENRKLIDVEGQAPGRSGARSLLVQNNGSIPATLTFAVESITDAENGIVEPEEEAAGETDDGGELAASLGIKISAALGFGSDPDVYFVGSSDSYQTVETLETGPQPGSIRVPAGRGVEVETSYRVSETAGDEIQSDSVRLTARFELTQVLDR